MLISGTLLMYVDFWYTYSTILVFGQTCDGTDVQICRVAAVQKPPGKDSLKALGSSGLTARYLVAHPTN